MPREGVPYPSREICSLKCQIDALNRKIDELMKSVNGVQGDGQGNVSLISGDPALVINNDQVHNEIELTLDPSLLPAAVVSSVNGQTGAVAIEAADVPASGGSDVQTELNAHATDIGNLFNALGAEATARQNADSALQTNINAVQAGIPAAAAAAVAADPTVAQIVVDLGDKVDTADVSTVQDPDTIAKRNGSGRLVAADPASSATDKTLVTANWVSQTGNSAPNNLLHRSGNENKTGILSVFTIGRFIRIYFGATVPNTWVEVARLPRGNTNRYFIEVNGGVNGSNSVGYGLLNIVCPSSGAPYAAWLLNKALVANSLIDPTKWAIVYDEIADTLQLYWKASGYGGVDIAITMGRTQASIIDPATVLTRVDFTPIDLTNLTGVSNVIPTVIQ